MVTFCMTGFLPTVCNTIDMDKFILKSEKIKIYLKTRTQFAYMTLFSMFCSQNSLETLGNKREYSLKCILSYLEEFK